MTLKRKAALAALALIALPCSAKKKVSWQTGRIAYANNTTTIYNAGTILQTYLNRYDVVLDGERYRFAAFTYRLCASLAQGDNVQYVFGGNTLLIHNPNSKNCRLFIQQQIVINPNAPQE